MEPTGATPDPKKRKEVGIGSRESPRLAEAAQAEKEAQAEREARFREAQTMEAQRKAEEEARKGAEVLDALQKVKGMALSQKEAEKAGEKKAGI